MDKPIFSEHWYRIAGLRPRLRAHVRLHRHEYRDHVWYLLQDHSSSRYHRFNTVAYQVIGLMDGERTVERIWQDVNTLLGDEAPVQDEMINLLGQLHRVDAIQAEVLPDVEELLQRSEDYQDRKKTTARIKNPLSIRLPLVDPDRFLSRTSPAVQILFSTGFFWIWSLLVGGAVILAAVNWDKLVESATYHALDPFNLALIFFTYPVVKLFHELGHAYAAKLEGGEVHEMGVIFLVFIPIPYVDASAATVFSERRKRMLVGAAGIMVELCLAALAFVLWLNVENGIVSSLCFSIMLIGGISTLFFNGNPLLRFDGYYILSDALAIPNLAQRSNQYLAYLIQRYAFGMEQAQSPVTARGESLWFLFYAIASFAYRMIIMMVICLFLLEELFIAGALLALWVVLSQLVFPVARQLTFVLVGPQLRRQRTQAVLTTLLMLTVITLLAFWVPVNSLSQFEGVVQPPDESHLVAETDGFIEQVLARPGAGVMAGQPLIQLQNIDHQGEMAVIQARMDELLAKLNAARVNDQVQAKLIRDEIAALQVHAERTRSKLESMLIRSPIDGFFILSGADDLPGQYVRKGSVLGYVVNAELATARVVVTQDDLNRLSERIDAIDVRLASRIDKELVGTLIREVPQARNQLPSRVLSVDGGGKFVPDPVGRYALSTRERLFEFEIELPLSIEMARIGTRVYVRFDHGAETLARQFQRRLRQLFLRRLGT